ncbi:MAG: transposase [Thermoanaerobaculia bacterium]
MSRPLRYTDPGGIYHVTSRGNEKQDIVRDDEDRLAFVELLARVALERQWIVHAWVLMTNHLHLVVTTPLANLSEGMHDILGTHASRFNVVHGRVGHLFQHRFDAKVVERETHLLELTRYIPLNPVRCGLVQTPAEWPWSSYRATAGFEPVPVWLEVTWILAQFHPTDRRLAQTRFREFVSAARDVEYDPWAEVAGGWILGSPQFCERVQRWIDTKNRSAEHPFEQRCVVQPDFEELIEIVKRELNLQEGDLFRRAHGGARKLIADLGHDECGMPFDAIAMRIGTTRWGAGKLRARSRELLLTDPGYADLIGRVRQALKS